MNCIPLLLCLVSLAQITPAIPEGTTVFTVTYKDGGNVAVVAAAIRGRDDSFIDIYDRANLPARLELVRDEPWNGYPREMVLVQNIVEAEPESSAKQRVRYENSGFEAVPTDSGSTWVPVAMKQRYDRMLALRETLESQRQAMYTSTTLTPADETSDLSGPGVAALWGRHVVILVMAVISIVVAVKVFF